MPSASVCLLDLDGTVYQGREPIPGARETLAALREAGLPFRFVTNTTRKPRSAVVESLRAMGIEVGPEEVLTAPRAAAGWLRERGAERLALLLAEATWEDLEGFERLAPGSEGEADYLLVGDLGEAWDYAKLNWGFRRLMAGARLVAVQRNRYWRREDGRVGLDAGAFVAALEYASGREAELVGKPSRAFFEAALAEVGAAAETTVMVGDDVESDVLGAQEAGLLGVAVRTGKFRPADEEKARAADAVLGSIAELPRWLGIG